MSVWVFRISIDYTLNCNFCSCIDPEGGSRIPRTAFGASQQDAPRTGVAPWPDKVNQPILLSIQDQIRDMTTKKQYIAHWFLSTYPANLRHLAKNMPGLCNINNMTTYDVMIFQTSGHPNEPGVESQNQFPLLCYFPRFLEWSKSRLLIKHRATPDKYERDS